MSRDPNRSVDFNMTFLNEYDVLKLCLVKLNKKIVDRFNYKHYYKS